VSRGGYSCKFAISNMKIFLNKFLQFLQKKFKFSNLSDFFFKFNSEHTYFKKKCGNKNTDTVNACGLKQSRRARFPWGLRSRSRVPNIEGSTR
jgi:hypothetical protein